MTPRCCLRAQGVFACPCCCDGHPTAPLILSDRYVQKELPLRIARRLLDLELLPHIVVTNPHIRSVYDGYRRSFDAFRSFPTVRSREDNDAFCVLLRQQLDEHKAMLDSLAAGLRECKSKQLIGPCLQLDPFFDSMLRSRISRLLSFSGQCPGCGALT